MPGKLTGMLAGKAARQPRPIARPAFGAGGSAFAPARSTFVPAKAVGSFVPKLTRQAFEKYGFATATLVTDWAKIAGADLASYAVPERLKWPRATGAYEDVAEGAEGRPGATLVLRVDPARALDVEYRRQQIAERINAYFGYRAIAAVRIVQAPVEIVEKPAPRALAASPPQVSSSPTPDADPLSSALARLAASVKGHNGRPAV